MCATDYETITTFSFFFLRKGGKQAFYTLSVRGSGLFTAVLVQVYAVQGHPPSDPTVQLLSKVLSFKESFLLFLQILRDILLLAGVWDMSIPV